MRRVTIILLPLLLTGSLIGAIFMAYAFKTSHGRSDIICSAVTQIAGPKPQDPTVRANLALEGRPFAAKPPGTERGWHYVALGTMVLPLPPGDWQRLQPDTPSTLFQAESPDLQVRVETYPYHYATAAAKLVAPAWIEFLLGDRLTRIKQPMIAAFRRDLSGGCDPDKDFRTLLLEALLTELKAVATNSGRAIAARWGRSPTRFALAYESNGTTIIRHTQKIGDDAYVIQYETASEKLAKTLLQQIELVPRTAIASKLPEKLAKMRAPRPYRNLNDSATLSVASEMCHMLTEDWETALLSETTRFIIPFAQGSSELTPEATSRLQEVAKEVERRSAKLSLTSVPERQTNDKDSNLLMHARAGAIRYWLLRNAGIIPPPNIDRWTETPDPTRKRISPAIIIELMPPESAIDADASERLRDEFTAALSETIKNRTTYIRSRRRGEETPIIGLLTPQQQGPFAVDFANLAERLAVQFDRKKLFFQDLSDLPGLAEITASSNGLTQDLAETLHDCMMVDFVLLPVLTSVGGQDERDENVRFEFTVQLIELSTLDLVGSWTSVHSAAIKRGSRALLGHETLPFTIGSDELTAEGRERLDRALRTARSRPGSTLKVSGFARRDESYGPDQDESCLALAAARQSAVELYLTEASHNAYGLRERAAPPSCGDLPIHQHAMLEIWSEREPTFWELGLLD